MAILKGIKEKTIIQKIRKGDNQAFIWLYDQYVSQIYRFVFLKTSSIQEAEDLTSETFLKFWQKVKQDHFSEITHSRGLLFQIARNLVIDYYRRKPRKEILLDQQEESLLAQTVAQESDLDQKMILESDLKMIKKAINQLKPAYQDLILWHYLDDFSVKEIAQITEKPEGALRVQLHRALKSLRTVIKKP